MEVTPPPPRCCRPWARRWWLPSPCATVSPNRTCPYSLPSARVARGGRCGRDSHAFSTPDDAGFGRYDQAAFLAGFHHQRPLALRTSRGCLRYR